MTSRFSLESKVAVITGAASGLGRETVVSFLGAGAKGITLVDLSAEALSSVVSSFSSSDQAKLLTIAGDISEPAANEQFAKETVDKFGRLDVAVLAAGVLAKNAPLEQTTLEDFDRTMKINIRGTFLGCQAASKAMLASPGGGAGCSIILFGSQLGLDGRPNMSPYIASKFAVRGLMASISQELGPRGIRVNTICPGPIDTPMLRVACDTDEKLAELLAPASIKRPGKPTEIADGALFLASEAGAYCAGTTLKIDGGWARFC